MKKLISFFLSALLIVNCLPVYAYRGIWYEMMSKMDENGDYVFEDGNVQIGDYVAVQKGEELIWVEYMGTDTELILPEGITAVSEFLSLSNRDQITSITFPDSMVSLGHQNFTAMSSLQEVKLPKDLTVIPNGTFMNCVSLETVNLPNTVTRIEDHALRGCTSLKRIDLPDGLEVLGYMAFAESGLTQVVVPPKVAELDWVFKNCKELKKIVLTSPQTQTRNWSKSTHTATVYLPKGAVSYEVLTKAGLNCQIIALNQSKLSLTKGQSKTLTFNCDEPAEKWKSSNPKVAAVDQTGKITAKSNGTATITATLYGKVYTCKITVSAKSYTVQRGDTLWGIAARELGSGYRYREIMELNSLTSTLIHRGKKLYLPA